MQATVYWKVYIYSLLKSGDKVRGWPANHKRLLRGFGRLTHVIKTVSQPDLADSDTVL